MTRRLKRAQNRPKLTEVNISLSPGALAGLDLLAKQMNVSRGTLVRYCVRQQLGAMGLTWKRNGEADEKYRGVVRKRVKAIANEEK